MRCVGSLRRDVYTEVEAVGVQRMSCGRFVSCERVWGCQACDQIWVCKVLDGVGKRKKETNKERKSDLRERRRGGRAFTAVQLAAPRRQCRHCHHRWRRKGRALARSCCRSHRRSSLHRVRDRTANWRECDPQPPTEKKERAGMVKPPLSPSRVELPPRLTSVAVALRPPPFLPLSSRVGRKTPPPCAVRTSGAALKLAARRGKD
ncbi:uncharacterized protein LOC110264941 [Arachis ipaensis]|uniref:uncharacterized protein LOC110264941 n=1 Tax=Arachis ipaensis TaxID=130454 RepID=UPI000A2B1357|nr:uncharacterized protein LOC110264941 [Arachis ipaensis]